MKPQVPGAQEAVSCSYRRVHLAGGETWATKRPVARVEDKDWFGGQGFSPGVVGQLAPTGSRQPQPGIPFTQVWSGWGQGSQSRPQQEAGTLCHGQNSEGEMHCLVDVPLSGRADTGALTGKMQASLCNAGSSLLSLSLSFSQRSKEGLRG